MVKKFINIKYKEYDINISAYIREAGENWILCMHGLQSNKELFDPIFKIQKLKQYSIIAFDLVGFGESSKLNNFSYDIKDQAEVCRKIMKLFSIKKVHLVGHSIGAMIGTLLLNNNIQSFISLEGNVVFEDCGTSAEVVKHDFKAFQKDYYPAMITKLACSQEQSGQMRSKWLQCIPDFVFYKTSHSIISWAKSQKLLTLFLHFTHRKLYIFGSKNAHKIKLFPLGTKSIEIPNSGHFMILENTKETFKAMEKFILSDS